MKTTKQRVVVGVSGGIDSAMTAYLLLNQGYEVIGVTMATHDPNSQLTIKQGCLSPVNRTEIALAKDLCDKLGIEHYVIEIGSEFNRIVLKYFRDVYLKGKTPNPCVFCNKEIKFELLPNKIREIGLEYDYYATGHYVRLIKDNDDYLLAKGADPTKDQSYFLSRIDPKILPQILLPLGDYYKREIREMAELNGFKELAKKSESQDFIEQEDYLQVFANNEYKSGDIVDSSGKTIGKHRGVIFYTVGQRKGLNLSGLPEPYYVLRIDNCTNSIVAGPKSELYSSYLVAEEVSWLYEHKINRELPLEAKIRFHHTPSRCVINKLENNCYEVEFATPQMAITPGQTIAFYQGEILLGGGIIK
ncbi:MAG: tRNA 2-thiouridine(34) synthase MnmA [Candidatus Cloacimonadia bacterium]